MDKPMFYIGFMYFTTLMMLPYTGKYFHVFLIIFYALAIIILLFRKGKKKNLIIILSFLFSILAVFSFYFSMEREIVPMEKLDGEKAFISGFVTELERDSMSGASRCVITVDNLSVNGKDISEAKGRKIRLSSKKYNPSLNDYLEYTGELYSLAGDDFSKAIYYRSKKMVLGSFTYGKIKVKGEGEIEVSKKELVKRKVLSGISGFSEKLFSPLNKYFSEEYSGVMKGMLSGDRSGFSEEQKEIFKRTGIMHLFAVSGFHTALWSMFIYKGLILSGIGRKKSSIFSILFILVFICFTGFPKSGIRAGIMLIVFFIGKLLKLGTDSLNSLGLAVFLILLFNPLAGGDLSLQLSAAATAGILILYPVLIKKVKKQMEKIGNRYIKKIISVLVPPLLVSFAAFISTFPFMVTGFGGVSLIGPLTNLLVSEAASLIIMLSGIGSILSLIPVISLLTPWFYLISGLLLKYLFFVTEKLSNISNSYVFIKGGWCRVTLAAVLLLLSVSIFMAPPEWRFNVSGEYKEALKRATLYWYRITALICLIIVLGSVFLHSVLYRGIYTVNFADTGNGTCIVCCHEGMACIIGCGGEKGKVTKAVSNILSENQVERVTCLVVPRKEPTESDSLIELCNLVEPELVLLPETFETGEMPTKNKVQFIEGTRIMPLPGVSLEINEDKGNPAALLKVQDLKVTMFFRPSISLLNLPLEYIESHVYYSRKAVPEELKRDENSTIIVSNYGPNNGSVQGTEPSGISVHYRNGRYALRRLKF